MQIEDVRSVFTDGVMMFSELEDVILRFGSCEDGEEVPLRVKMRWVKGEALVAGLLGRVQGFKSSTSLLLNIFQWYVCFVDFTLFLRNRV